MTGLLNTLQLQPVRTESPCDCGALVGEARTFAPRANLEQEALADQLALVAKGQQRALAAVYKATSARLFSLSLRILRDRRAAEDVLQETYVTVWVSAGRFDRDKGSAGAWLTTVVRNKSIDALRSRAPGSEAPMEMAEFLPDPSAGADSAAERSEAIRRLQSVLDGMEPRTARAIRAAFYEGLTYRELAKREGVPAATLKSRVRRGLLRMRSELGDSIDPTGPYRD